MSGIRDALQRARELADLEVPATGALSPMQIRPEEPPHAVEDPGHVREDAKPSQTNADRADGQAPSGPTTEELLAMSYEEFVKADLVLHIRSTLLREDIAIASNEGAAKRAWDGVVVYLMEEFRHLYAGGELDEAALRVLHRLKKKLPDSRMTGTSGYRSPQGTQE